MPLPIPRFADREVDSSRVVDSSMDETAMCRTAIPSKPGDRLAVSRNRPLEPPTKSPCEIVQQDFRSLQDFGSLNARSLLPIHARPCSVRRDFIERWQDHCILARCSMPFLALISTRAATTDALREILEQAQAAWTG